jgi:phenylalanyl-tRNA synthetase beta chain
MKLSLNQLRQCTEAYNWSDDLLDITVNSLVDKIGAQLGGIDEVDKLGDKYKGIIIVKVVECIKHPNADKLSLCKIDDGGKAENVARDDKGLVQVVCGAPNVRAGLTVAWLPPGSTVPDSIGKDPFTLEARELRGAISNGMLASPKELALNDNHDGILELDDDQLAGADFAEAYGLKDEVILDIENKMFTHRPDCFGLIGLAREIAGIEGKPFHSPDWYKVKLDLPAVETEQLPFKVNNELPEKVSRFTVIAMSEVKVGPSPLWLQIGLNKLGVRSINNVVDLTNYYMLLTGQPLHAYDYDKVKQLSSGDEAVLTVRSPRSEEEIELLNGKTVEPRSGTIMIATDTKAIAIGGVMGGVETEVDDSTKNILIESANFNMYSVRRTSMENGLFTDGVTRFTKGQSPLQTLSVLLKIVEDMKRLTNAKVASEVLDNNNIEQVVMERESLFVSIDISLEFINTRLGLNLSEEEISTILSNVEFKVEKDNDNLKISAPFWRTDIELREDVVEEVGRLYGYDKLPLVLPKRSLAPAVKDELLEAKSRIRSRLSRYGANEILTYSFVDGNLLEKSGQDKEKAFELSNALRPELQFYRLSLVPSLLDKVHPNQKAGYDEFALFEIGKSHSLDQVNDGEIVEFELTALVVAANDKLKKAGSAYYQAKDYLCALAGTELEFEPLPTNMADSYMAAFYSPNRSAKVTVKSTQEFLGVVGEFKPEVSKNLKLPKYCAGFEVDTTVIGKLLRTASSYKELSRFPGISQDISLKVKKEVSYKSLSDLIGESLTSTKPDKTTFSLSPRDIYESEKDPEHKNITLRLNISCYARTMTDTEVAQLLDAAAQVALSQLHAERL